MPDDFVPTFETLELDEVSPEFAQTEYTRPKVEDTATRMGSISLGSVPMGDSEAPYGYNADGSIRKRRGRPPGSKNTATSKLATARDSKEVAKRLDKMLLGATGVLSVIRPHLQMTDDESMNISDPLAAYLVRQEQFSPRIKEFIDHYDLAAAGIAFLAYLVRVYRDDVEYRKSRASDVVEVVSNRRPSRRRNESNDAAPQSDAEVRQSSVEDGGERTQSDGDYVPWFPTPYIAGE